MPRGSRPGRLNVSYHMRCVMSRILSVMVFGLMLAVAGCNKNTDTASGTAEEGTMSAGADACPHCPGTQTATANGTCPKCGMKAAQQ